MHQLVAVTRRLAAIAFADVAGWSRLMEQNDVETLRAWKSLRARVLLPKALEHGGQLIEVTGDAALFEFPSAVAAVTWALDAQRLASDLAPDAKGNDLSLRIGINVEDVIVDDDKRIGDGVNIASRIHQLAPPGEITITGAVHHYVWNKMAVEFHDLGERQLKNIGRPIRVYQVMASKGGAKIAARSQPHLSWSNRPAIAVLPFRELGGDPGEKYFGEGITEDIINGLARSHSMYVIARNSTLQYGNPGTDLQSIATELGVRYILKGSVRRQSAQLRISAELFDATDHRTVWAEKFDGADDDIFAFQDRIATSIVGALEPKLYQIEAAHAFAKPTESLDAYNCLLRALPRLYTFNDHDFAQSGEFLRRAIALDPAYAQAQAYLAWWLNIAAGEGRSSDPDGDAKLALRASAIAVECDPGDAFCLAVAGHIQAFLDKNLDAAVDLFDRALAANENSAFAWGVSASTYCFLGRGDDAMDRLRNARRLSPFDPLNFWFLTVAGIAEFVSGRYDQAIGWLYKAQRFNGRFSACHRTLTACLALSGEVEAAKVASNSLLLIEPSFRVSQFITRYPLRRKDDLNRLAEGLRLAGLPE